IGHTGLRACQQSAVAEPGERLCLQPLRHTAHQATDDPRRLGAGLVEEHEQGLPFCDRPEPVLLIGGRPGQPAAGELDDRHTPHPHIIVEALHVHHGRAPHEPDEGQQGEAPQGGGQSVGHARGACIHPGWVGKGPGVAAARPGAPATVAPGSGPATVTGVTGSATLEPAGLLDQFRPVVRDWFWRRFPAGPTPAQSGGWPAIASGRHTLIAAPTGSGKTLAAFLVAIDRLLREGGSADGIRVVYVSPLKALAADIHHNLELPLEQMRRQAADAGQALPEIRVALRTGDTPAGERARLLKQVPSLLVTTPE